MAANSIAKLSIMLTGDTAPLARDLNRGSALITQFNGKVATQTTAMAQAGQAAKGWGAALGVAGGNLGRLAAVASLGPQAGLVIAAATAVKLAAVAGKIAFNFAVASDALEVAAGGKKLDTWAGQWERVQKASVSIAQSLGRPNSEMWTSISKEWADIMGLIAQRIMPEAIRQEREKVRLLELQNKLIQQQHDMKAAIQNFTKGETADFMKLETERMALRKKHLENSLVPGAKFKFTPEKGGLNLFGVEGGLGKADAKRLKEIQATQEWMHEAAKLREFERKAAEGIAEAQRAMHLRGEAIAESLQTPIEKFREAIAELEKLHENGNISIETLRRGAAQAQEDLIGASKAMERIKSFDGPVGAAERFTTAGQSAVAASQRNLAQALAEAARQTKLQQEMVKELQEISRMERNKKGVTLATSNLQ